MGELGLILIGAVLVNNFVLTQFLGLCPLMGASRQRGAALGLAMATGFVLTLSALLSYLLYTLVLAPLALEFLRTPAYILVIAGAVQFTELFVRYASPVLHATLGVYLPLIASNCAVLGVALLAQQESLSLLGSALYGAGAAAGFGLVMVLFAELRERIAAADVPAPFQGASVALITAGIMSLAFLGFRGFGGL